VRTISQWPGISRHLLMCQRYWSQIHWWCTHLDAEAHNGSGISRWLWTVPPPYVWASLRDLWSTSYPHSSYTISQSVKLQLYWSQVHQAEVIPLRDLPLHWLMDQGSVTTHVSKTSDLVLHNWSQVHQECKAYFKCLIDQGSASSEDGSYKAVWHWICPSRVSQF